MTCTKICPAREAGQVRMVCIHVSAVHDTRDTSKIYAHDLERYTCSHSTVKVKRTRPLDFVGSIEDIKRCRWHRHYTVGFRHYVLFLFSVMLWSPPALCARTHYPKLIRSVRGIILPRSRNRRFTQPMQYSTLSGLSEAL